MTQATLSALRDVEGVLGSFLLTDTGKLLAKDLPAVFHDDVLLETGPRILRLCESIEHGGEALEGLALRFTDHSLHVRRSRGGLLCVIAGVHTNAAALRMASTLVARRLGTLSAGDSEPPRATAATSEQAKGAVSNSKSRPPPMIYRGHRVGPRE
jgi:hypothetical protein